MMALFMAVLQEQLFLVKVLTLPYMQIKNYLRLNNFAGLNIIDGYKIWCHYNIKDESDLKKIKGKIIVLYEESGLFYDGVKMQSIGKSFFIVDNK